MPIVTLPGGELRDEIRQPLYDTYTMQALEALAGDRSFFQSITGKSLAETNMKQPGSLQTAVSFRVQGIAFDAQNDLLSNQLALTTFIKKSSLQLVVGEKIYWQGPVRFAAGRMLTAAVGTTAAQTTVSQQYGWPAVQPIVLQGKHVIDINPLQNFSLNWQTLAANLTTAEAAFTLAADTDLPVVASLKGLQRRPVQ